MKIFTTAQIHELDKYTIEHEPIASLNLMERAARALTQAVMEEWSADTPVFIFAGPGNNGGDALAMARMLSEQSYRVSVYLFNISGQLSSDCAANKQRLQNTKGVKNFVEVSTEFDHQFSTVTRWSSMGSLVLVSTSPWQVALRHLSSILMPHRQRLSVLMYPLV